MKKIDRCELSRKAIKYIDNYLDMGCFREPKTLRPAFLEGFEFGYTEAEKDIQAKYDKLTAQNAELLAAVKNTIAEFERLRDSAPSLRDAVYLGAVLVVLNCNLRAAIAKMEADQESAAETLFDMIPQ